MVPPIVSLPGGVHDSDPMGRHASCDSIVGPGYEVSTLSGFSPLFLFLLLFDFFFAVFICFFALALSHNTFHFLLFVEFLIMSISLLVFHCLKFVTFSVSRYLAYAHMLWHGNVLLLSACCNV